MRRCMGAHKCWIPDHELEALARSLFPEIQAYFESEEGKREFAAWQEEQQAIKRKATATGQ